MGGTHENFQLLSAFGCKCASGLLIGECKALISPLTSQSIYDAIHAIKRLHHMCNSQSELRPSFGIEILK